MATMRTRRKPGERKQIVERWRAIRKGYPWNEPLTSEDDAFIRSVLPGHPEAELKVGVGIDHFYVDSDRQGDCCIWALRLDGTTVDIGLNACLSPPTPFQEFSNACRIVVARDVLAAKDAAFAGRDRITCPVTGVEIDYETAHAHHQPPWTFHAIVLAFIVSRPDIDPGNLKDLVNETVDGSTKTLLVSGELATAFYNFHHERARLVIVSARANTNKLGEV